MRRVDRRAVFLACSLVACSCADNGDSRSPSVEDGTAAPAENRYSSDPLPIRTHPFYRSDELGFPHSLALFSEHLVVADPYSEPHLHILDRSTGELVGMFGRHGDGPGEYRFPGSIAADRDAGIVWVGDSGVGRVTGISLDAVTRDVDSITTLFSLREAFGELLPLPDSGFIAADFTGSSRFFLLDAAGRLVTKRGGPTETADGDVPAAVAGRVYAEAVAVHPRGDRIAGGGVWTGSLTIYGLDGAVRDSADAPIRFAPRFDSQRSGAEWYMVPDPGSRVGYVALAATANHVMGVFPGRSLDAYGEEANAGRDIHLFDWQGRLVRVYRLDTAVTAIAVDSETNEVYGSRWGDDPSIVRFDLPITP